jgi:hypothetical protein
MLSKHLLNRLCCCTWQGITRFAVIAVVNKYKKGHLKTVFALLHVVIEKSNLLEKQMILMN